jgi:Transposase IS66 family
LGLLDDLDLSAIQDERARRCVVLLLNLVEQLKREDAELRAEVQRLRDEIAQLKGEQPRPKIKGNTPKPPPTTPTNYSSEKERRIPKEWTKANKTETIPIDREETVVLDSTTLPEDAEFKGHEDVVVQDIVLGTDNVLFHKEKFYSPSQGETYLAPLPVGYEGQFGPSLKALTVLLYFGANVSEPKIVELYRSVGVSISKGQVSNLLIKAQEPFHAEKAAVIEAGLASTPWQHLDDTNTRVNGQNQYCQIVCNPFYTSYQTTESKDRQTILDVLRNGRPREYRYNAEAESLLAGVLSGVAQKQLSKLPRDERVDEPTMIRLLAERLGSLGPQQRKWVLDATTPHSLPGLPRSWLSAGFMRPGTRTSSCPTSRPTSGSLASSWSGSGTTTTTCWPIASTRARPSGSGSRPGSTRCSRRSPSTRPTTTS